MKRLNNKGAALIIAFFIMSVLVTLSIAFAILTFGEVNDSRRYRDSLAAFWLAESGISLFMQNTSLLNQEPTQVFTFKNGTVTLTKDDSHPAKRIVKAIGSVNGVRRSIQIEYPANAPEVFNNTISVNGNIVIAGSKSSLAFNDKTRINGRVLNSTKHSIVYFEDRQNGVNAGLVSLTYPDINNNGKQDEFEDFKQFNRNLLASYPKSEIIYIEGNDAYTITTNKNLNEKKIIYIEGSSAGNGNAVIQFSGALAKNQNLTVITTGTVTNNLAGLAPEGSKLNIIAWSDYFETTVLPSIYNGMIYTHGTAHFDEMHDTSVTNGCIVANGDIVIKEVWSTKTINYADMRAKGVVPPGFEGLVGGGISGYARYPSSWLEI